MGSQDETIWFFFWQYDGIFIFLCESSCELFIVSPCMFLKILIFPTILDRKINFLHGDLNNLEKLYLSTINNGQHCQICSHLLNYLQKDNISVVLLSSARHENKWPRP